jgi:ribosomal protein L7/L12
MPPLSKAEIVDAIKNMSVLELSELSKELQDVFGVSAAAPMMAMPGMMPGAPAGAEAAPVEEAPTSFDVVLTAIGDKKINVIKVVREVTSLGLKEAKDLVEAAPSKIKEGVNMDDAKALQAKFEAEGAKIEIKPAALTEALGITPVYVGRNRFDYLVAVDSEAKLRALQPDFTRLRAVATRGVIVTSRSAAPEYDFVSRFFAPAAGIDEDPVTGSAHCCLGPFWSAQTNKTEFVAYQASARSGVVRVRLQGSRVLLGGQAVTVLRGELMGV